MGKRKRTKLEAAETTVPKVYKSGLGTAGIKPQPSKASGSIGSFKVTKAELKKRKERESRFSGPKSNARTDIQSISPAPGPLYRSLTSSRRGHDNETRSSDDEFIGLNQELEKPYLRLTDYPKAEDVRPFQVLVKSLAHIKSKYNQNEDFEWANDQLKSLRQDMTVQPSIRNNFVLDVYETHARLLIENGDLDEFNKCQTMISSLTGGHDTSVDDSFGGIVVKKKPASTGDSRHKKKPLKQSLKSLDEFTAYAILYGIIRNSHLELKTLLPKATVVMAQDSEHSHAIYHALQVLTAINTCDYRTFFKLYPCCPNLSAFFMDFLVKRVRLQAMERIVAAYRPTVSVEQLREWLSFDDLEDVRRFLRQTGAVFLNEPGSPAMFYVDCKGTATILALKTDFSRA